MTTIHRQHCITLDATDPLAALREQFTLPDDLIYLDGNSLGALPRATPVRVQQVMSDEWGEGLIRSWNTAGWIDLPRRVGNKIARLVGAAPDELVVTDSTSINLYKVLSAALAITRADAPQRRVIVSERENFPTDLYMAQSLAAQYGMQLVLVEKGQALSRLRDDVAVLLLTQVNYRSGALHDMAAVTAAAHAAGVLTVWDLAHSAGAVPVDLNGAQADFAIGCGYKYLNGGPGAPAFVWVHARHVNRVEQPLSGWHGHAAPFVFTPGYQPAQGIARYLCGTPTLLSLAALDCGVDTVLAAEPLGGMQALRRKSLALSDLFIRLVQEQLSAHPITVATPLDAAQRGSQVSLTFDGDGYAVMQALIARGVIGDFRAGDKARGDPDLLRFGFTPLYLRHVDVFDAVQTLRDILDSGTWREARFARKGAVT
ncbi:MAG: kynureninase [Thiomonas sp.]|nr:kynureninase [Thiomonas sp.]